MQPGDEVLIYNSSIGILKRKIDDNNYEVTYSGYIYHVNIKDLKPITFKFKKDDLVHGEYGQGQILTRIIHFGANWYNVYWKKLNRSWEVPESKLETILFIPFVMF